MTDRELAEKAAAHLKATTITYQDWQRRVDQGKYNPPDGSTTQWGMAFAALDQIGTVVPPPDPVEPDSPFGGFSNQAYFPATNQQYYGYVSSVGAEGPAFKGHHCFYRTGITCQTGGTNITELTCVQNNWQMKDAAGNALRNVAHGGVLADPGLAGYQQAWCDATWARLQQLGVETYDGVWIDDVNPRPSSLSGGVVPAKYPTNAQYEAALADFARAQHDYFGPKGKNLAWNTGIPSDDNCAQMYVWWPKVAPYINYLTKEFWMWAGGHVRTTGTGNWDRHWESHRGLHKVCQDAGCGFLPLSGGHGSVLQDYGLCTFMLDWTGHGDDGFFLWSPSESWAGTTDPWAPIYAEAIALGAPSPSPATLSGQVWTRQYEHGAVWVNPTTGTAGIN